MKRAKHYDYDVAISYAGEDREYAEALAKTLQKRKIKVFYDIYEKAALWGKNLYDYLSDLYQYQARFCVMFLSQHYAAKLWTNHERRAAQTRAFEENEEYILPIRLDKTEIPGIFSTIAYLSWPPETADTIADLILTKLGREPYVPLPQPAITEVSISTTFTSDTPTAIPYKGSKTKEQAEDTLLQEYIEKIEKSYKTERATELTYRLALEELITKLIPGVSVTHEPMREEYGSPDFMISRSTNHGLLKIGYIETKDVDISLEKIEQDALRIEPKTRDGQQLKRYLGALENLLLTNYREFYWYLHGERRMTSRLISPVLDRSLPLKAKGRKKGINTTYEQLLIGMHAQSTASVAQLFTSFLTHTTEPINNPKELAVRMARIAHIIRDMTIVALKSGDEPGTLQDLYDAFKRVLLPELDIPQFADMFAQTLAYGLFAARYNHKSNEPFRRQNAAREISNTNPFLADLFEKITGRELDRVPFVGFVDDLAQLLAQTDMNAVLADFGKHTRQEEPLIHFYETFLIQYNPELRELRGVYYTPEPVVSYIVRSVNYLLQTQFGCKDGLADTSMMASPSGNEAGKKSEPRVLLLDPACGTGTFLYNIISYIREEFRQTNNAGAWSSYVRDHLLPRLFGFELLMAPYAMAHLKLAMQLAALDLPEQEQREWAYDFRSRERLGLYLTNSLDEAKVGSELLFGRYISEEANAAAEIKSNLPIMVILGNPPYSGHSANKGPWITELLHKAKGNYFEVDGKPLDEKNPKWLNNDYVKFIRFAQWRIEQTGYGILAFITDNSYLDSPTFRGMRRSLMQSFDEIYVLNLHGNSMQKERAPDGTKDENVFDIQQGVAIGIFVKRQQKTGTSSTVAVYHADLWGLREIYEQRGQTRHLIGGKYYWLDENDIKTTNWTTLMPRAPFYLFVPQNADLQAEYEKYWSIVEALPLNNIAMQTHRDYFVTDLDSNSLRSRITSFRDGELSDSDIREQSNFGTLNISKARTKLQSDPNWETGFVQCLWRPFDIRFLYYHTSLIDRPRSQITEPLLKPNLALLAMRQIALQEGCSHFLVTNKPPIDRVFYSNKGAASVFPLYIYPDLNKKELFDTTDSNNTLGERRPNLSAAFIESITNKLKMHFVFDGKGDLQQTFGPEDVFDYMYAVSHSPTYRSRYAEFLKFDFPRLPLTSAADLFRELCLLGERLVNLHLMEKSGPITTSYPVKGDDFVEKVEYKQSAGQQETGSVWINKRQYFDGIPLKVWKFHVGGYQVCQKWLKDRKGRTLSYDDIRHYQRIIAILSETLNLMDKVDDAIEGYGGWPIK